MSSEKQHPPLLPQLLIPPLIDFSLLAGILFGTPSLAAQFLAPSPSNHAILIPAGILMVAGIVAIRCLPNYSLNEKNAPSIVAVCLIFFHVVIFSMLYVHATVPGGDKQKTDAAIFIVFVILLIAVLGAFSWPVRKAEPNTAKALFAQSIGLISVNYLTLIGTAVWDCFQSAPTGENPVYATGISFVVLFTVMYLLFLAFFGLPRVYLLRATGDKIGLSAYLAGVALFLWNKLPPVN